jgi:serine/threonine-protein kinase RsbW
MVGVKSHTTEEYLAVPESVAEARAVAVDFARATGMRGQQLENLRLAVSEAVTNVVRHAYPRGEGTVALTIGRAGDELWILVADRGCGYQTRSANPGLGLIAHDCDEMVITERAEGGTEVRMLFVLGPQSASDRETFMGAAGQRPPARADQRRRGS